MCNGLGDIGRDSITGSDVMPISPLGVPNLKPDRIFWKPTSDFQLVDKRNETPICKGFGDIGRVSITGSDVMPISPLGGVKLQIRPHILKALSINGLTYIELSRNIVGYSTWVR